MDFKFRKVKLSKFVKYGILGAILLISAFMIFYKPGEVVSVNDAIEGLKGYQKEAYYTVRVINDFDWNIEYTYEGLVDTITPFVPRIIWDDKPYSGFYQRYWRDIYEPNAVLYQTSTFGALAEAHMMFGMFGAFLYAIIFYFICKKSFIFYQKINTFFGMFIVAYVQCSMYFFVRGGLFSSTVVAFVYQSIIAYIILVLFQKLFKRNNEPSKHITYKKM
ncbi:hypothetical protein [Clostridium folliculivorans]|nr:hypothetical protein [Clostridium folliculivorans]